MDIIDCIILGLQWITQRNITICVQELDVGGVHVTLITEPDIKIHLVG